ncbi:MAG: hypothetical protein BGO76_06420 [Caedibacter sp. 38-128]|nr:MAG: hypothetical protein BGO76_06420 [Caedibacter sp. 38-128]
MPTIDELKLKSRSKKFEKVSYRPWEIDVETSKTPTSIDHKEEQNSSKDTLNHTGLPSENNIDFTKTLRALYGLQKNILFYLCNKISHEDSQYAYTFAFSVHDLVEYTRSTKNSIASSLLRLKQKNLISAHENKPGRGGFASYRINKDFCKFLRQNSINNP